MRDAAAGGPPPKLTTPYHEGERLVQERLGVLDEADRLAVIIQDELGLTARLFVAGVALVVLGSTDDVGCPWATVLVGESGFVRCSPGTVRIRAIPAVDDPLNPRRRGEQVGLLAFDPIRRLRYRINGPVLRWGPEWIEIRVTSAYGNCRRHITPRPVGPSHQATVPARRSTSLTPAQLDWIGRADTFFLTTSHPSHGADTSHRGGPPGFIQATSDTSLRFPDYAGNNMCNSLGNLMVEPRLGLAFRDFATGGSLQLTGEAVVTPTPAPKKARPEVTAHDNPSPARHILDMVVTQVVQVGQLQ